MEQENYTKPTLCHYDYDLSKAWFVWFDITNPQTKEVKRKQFKGGINFIKTVDERLQAGQALATFWKNRLKNGWTPFVIKQIAVKDFSRMKFSEALEFALDNCTVARKCWTIQAFFCFGSVMFCKSFANRGFWKNALFHFFSWKNFRCHPSTWFLLSRAFNFCRHKLDE